MTTEIERSPSTTENTVGLDDPTETTDESTKAIGQCPECRDEGSLVTNGTTSETYCTECGLVVSEDPLDRGPEWHPANAERERRVGGPLTNTRHDRGLSAEIGRRSDGYGKPLSGSKRSRFYRLRKWNNQAKFDSKRERGLAHGLSEIQRIASVLDLSDTLRERAAYLFRRAQDEDLLIGQSIESMAAASVYAACRLQRLPRFLEEVSEAARVDRTSVKTAYKTLNREFELATPPPLPQDFLPRIATEVDAPTRIRERGQQLSESPVVGKLTAGRKPAGVAAACLYHASRELGGYGMLSQAATAEAAHVTEVTIRTIWHELRDLDLPPPG